MPSFFVKVKECALSLHFFAKLKGWLVLDEPKGASKYLYGIVHVNGDKILVEYVPFLWE